MLFGNCKECNEYKYLPEQSKCESCISSDDTDWKVMHVRPLSGHAIYKKNLSEDKAKSIARGNKFLIPTQEE